MGPLSFFSKKLSTADTCYRAFDRELLAVYTTICHFSLMLEVREFFILTNNKPLCNALGRLLAPWSARQQRHLAYISELKQDIRRIPDKDNVAADTLSQLTPCRTPLNFHALPLPTFGLS